MTVKYNWLFMVKAVTWWRTLKECEVFDRCMLGCEFTRFLMCFHAVVFGEKTETGRCVCV